jgi:ribosomal protein S18 acetylase RimI-like enzyme
MIAIRPLEPADRDAVVCLWKAVFPDDPARNDPDAVLARKARVQPELFLVAEDDGAVIGTVVGGYDGHRGWAYHLAVDPAHRRQGIGRRLMDELEARLAGLGCPKLNLQVRESNTAVVEFYRRLGYQVERHVSLGKVLEGGAGGAGPLRDGPAVSGRSSRTRGGS